MRPVNFVILILFLSSLLTPIRPYNVAEFSQAIVDNGLGKELSWYTPRIEVTSIKNAPKGWKAAASCKMGMIVINPLYANAINRNMTIMHELVHLHNNCYGSEENTTMMAYEAMASLGRDEDILADLYYRVSVLADSSGLSEEKLETYYRHPVNEILTSDLAEYGDLRLFLEHIRLR